MIMSKTIKDGTKNTDPLLDFCKHSETELDYEYAESHLESKDGQSEVSINKSNAPAVVTGSELPKLSEKIKPVAFSATPIPRQKQTTKTGSKFRLQELINKNGSRSPTPDVLDLHRMAEKFAGAKSNILQNVQKVVCDTGGFNYEKAIALDRMLGEAHMICDKFGNKLDDATRGKLLKLITEMEDAKKVHSKEKAKHVANWLNNHTSQPEPEMCGFTLQDPFQLRKFVSGVRPRKCTSDTNIALGKRKRGYEDCGIDDISSVHGSSSDTRVFVHADWSRPCAHKKSKR